MENREIWQIYGERPGLFHISLTASQNPPAQQITHRITVTEKLIRGFPDGFTNRAAWNLLGVLYFYNGQFFQAVKTFEKVLQLQPDSLTAMANLAFVYQRIKQNAKAAKYTHVLSYMNGEDQARKGIALADQAFAFLFDCYMEKDAIERNKLPKELLVQSLVLLGNSEHHKAVALEIKYWLGVTYYNLFAHCHYRKDKKDMEKEFYLKGVKELVEITKEDNKVDLYIQREIISTSWGFLGLFLSRIGSIRGDNSDKTIEQIDDEIKMFLRDVNLLQYLDKPEQCFKIGLLKAPVAELKSYQDISTEILIRYALFLKTENRLEEALDKLNEALKIDNKQGNWFALTVKADVLAKLERVDEAIENRKVACAWNTCPTDLCELAKAYEKKYNSCKDKNSEEAEEYLLNASDWFTRAVQLLGQEKRPEIHRAHGNFLRNIGEIKEAIECFKRAMEVDFANNTSFQQLFETLLLHYKSSQDSEKMKIMHEMAYIYDVTLRKRGELKVETETFLNHFEEEMATLTAYFKLSRSEPSLYINEKSLSDIITSAVKEDALEKWHTMVEKQENYLKHAKETKLATQKKDTVCSRCRGMVTERQLSVFPDSPEKPRSLKYPYDFYVIFSPTDRDWVCHILLETLEVSYGYKGAVAERDIVPGSTDLYQRVNLIHSCSKILVILGQNFEGNLECDYELSHALKRKHDDKLENILIPIRRTVDGVHQSLKTITFLDAVDDCDWNRLIKALEWKP